MSVFNIRDKNEKNKNNKKMGKSTVIPKKIKINKALKE